MDITNKDFPSRHCIPIAKRYDDDNLICIVVSDLERPPGSTVIDVHFTARPGSEIDAEFASMDVWARLASEEIEDSIRTGRNAPIADRLREDD